MNTRSSSFLCLVCLFIRSANTFNMPNIFKSSPFLKTQGSRLNEESGLLEAISFTANGKNADVQTQARVLKLVRRLETMFPPSLALLSDSKESKILDGDWFLQYTQPSEIESVSSADKWVPVSASEGKSRINTRQFNAQGTVSAGGIRVDTSSNIARQSLDIKNGRITNEILTNIGRVTVSGTFKQSKAVPQRAIVAFDTAQIVSNIGVIFDLSFLFDIRAALKGSKDAGWVETTYVSKDIRIGRGNKGSLFILTRNRDAVLS